MRKHTKLFVLVAALLAVLALSAVAAPFEKVATYADGTFTDVGTQWYAKEVKSAYELGFVNGKTANSYDPNGTMTVAEAITLASRVHASYNSNTIAPVTGKWYLQYVEYAKTYGIFEEGYFNNYDRTVRRYEMAQLFANALPDDYFPAKNNVTAIPDVNENEEYADMLLMLYKAGVVMGSDEYGTFHPTDPIKRSEVAAIVNRAALPENRLAKTLTPAPVYENEAVYLIDNYDMMSSTLRYTRLKSSWNADNRYNESIIPDGVDTNVLVDATEKGYANVNRDFESQTKGQMTLRTDYVMAGNTDGLRIYFENSKGENILEFYTKDGVYNVKGLADIKTGLKSGTGAHALKAYIDLDAKKGYFTVDGVKAGEFQLGNFGDFKKIYISTSVEDKVTITAKEVHLYMNYFVNEDFYAPVYPEDWEAAANTEITKGSYDGEGTNTLKLTGNTTVTKKFEPLSGKFVFESYVLVPEKADVATVKVGDVAVTLNNNVITAGTLSKSHRGHIWQCIHVEGDTTADTAVIYINGKKQGNIPMSADSVDSVSFVYEKKSEAGYMLIDDVEVYNIYDYLDYVPVPVPAQDDEYTTIMSVCSLWREGTHYGWDFVAPYEEATPVWGFYDEGIPETADWETKMMVEHGIDAFQYCWFAPSTSAYDNPIKTPKLAWSQHDGYFYSEYSDMIKFCFMWENAGWAWAKQMSIEQFKTYIWDYWVDWYFTDERYLVVDNKPVLHIYKPENFVKTMGGEAEAKACIEFMREDIKNYGFDGIIVLFQDSSYKIDNIRSHDALGADGVMTYAWGADSYAPTFYTEKYKPALQTLKTLKTDMYIVPTVGMGRNILGWNNVRTPTSSIEEHTEMMTYLAEVTKTQNVPGNMIYFGTWNEFGEGHWLAPSGLNGFGYADVWRSVLNGEKVHDDVVPTINQMERICNLYNDERTPIRLQHLEKKEIPAKVIETFDFLNGYVPEIGTYGVPGMWSKDRLAVCEIQETGLVMVSESTDPIFRSPTGLGISCEDMTGIKITVKASTPASAQIFFITDLNNSWESSKRYDVMFEKSDDYIEYYIDCTTNALWTGTLDCLRFDLMNGNGRLDIAKIEYVGKADSVGKVYVDGMDLQIPAYYVQNTGDEFYVVGDPDYGIYSANNFYHLWYKEDGAQKLYIKTGTETEFVFTVGSDKVLVNGAEKTLKKAFYTFDGVPVLPMKFILDTAKIEYTCEKDLSIKMREIDMASILEWRKKNPWNFEFEIPNDTENFKGNGGSVMVSNGHLVLTAGESQSAATGHDSGIIYAESTLTAKKYEKVVIRYKYEFLEDAKPQENFDSHSNLQFYFNPSTNPGLSEAKSYRVRIDETPVDDEGWHIAEFKLSENEHWDGMITTLRFDPTNHNGIYTFDYIRFVLKEGETAESGNKGSSTGSTLEELVGDGELVYDMDFKADGDANHPTTVTRASYTYEGDDLVVTTAADLDVILHFAKLPEPLQNAANFDTAVVRMKLDNANAGQAQFFYMNKAMTSFAGEANAPATFQPGKNTDDEGYYLLKFDFTKNKSKFTGELSQLRFDPADMANTTFSIDYIKFYKCGAGGGTEEAVIPQLKPEDVTNPGVIYNGDAEGEDFSMWSSSSSELSIVTEENGNRAFLLTPNTGKKAWVYLMTTYNFTPGKTYKIEADVKVISDEAGTPGESKVTCNFRYQDTENGQNGYDHNTVFAISNGEWAHMEGEYKVETMDKPQNKVNQFSFYCNPIGELGCKYMVDNIKVTIID